MISGDNEVLAAKDEVPCFVECPGDDQGLAIYRGVVLLSNVCVAVAGECQFPAGLATRRFIRRTGAVFLSEGETDAVLAPVSGQACFPSQILTPSAIVLMISLLACAKAASNVSSQ